MLPHKVDDEVEFLHVVDVSVLLDPTYFSTNTEAHFMGQGVC